MAKVVGAAGRRGACPVLWDGRGAGLVPDPAVKAFAERAAAGTAEQPPIFGAPKARKCQRRRRASCGGIGTVLMAPSGRCLRPRGSRGVPLLVQARADRGREAVRVSCPQPRGGRAQGLRRTARRLRRAAVPRSTGSRRTRSAPAGSADPRPGSPAPRQGWPLTAGPLSRDDLGGCQVMRSKGLDSQSPSSAA